MRVVYVDTLFFFNFAVNRLLLEGTRLVLRTPAKHRRLTAGALLGAAYAVACVMAPGSLLECAAARVAFGVLMVAASFGVGGRTHVAKCCLAFFCLSAALGGGIFGLYYLLGNGSDFALLEGIAYLDLPFGAFALFFVIAYPLCLWGYRLFTVGEGVTRRHLPVTLTVAGKSVTATALLDTGCSLCEPLTGRPAVVVQRALLFERPLEVEALPQGFVLLPFSTVGGHGLLPALRGQRLEWREGEETVAHTDFYVALSERALSPDGSFEILLPHLLAVGAQKKRKEEVDLSCR